jgi:hypothetical protein
MDETGRHSTPLADETLRAFEEARASMERLNVQRALMLATLVQALANVKDSHPRRSVNGPGATRDECWPQARVPPAGGAGAKAG